VPAIGITGGVATGKTSFCDCLREILPSAKFFNADKAARALVDLDQEVPRELRSEFGDEVFSPGGDLNRAALRAIVFASATKKAALEKILHPRIRRQWSAEAQTHRNSSDFFFADIPLLYETGGETLCDRVVVVACAPSIQAERLLARGGIDRAVAQEIMNSQMPLAEKIARANHVVWNDGARALLSEQARMLVDLWISK
jgi:dephospho-CoA kinase